jgi:hypothetical protein
VFPLAVGSDQAHKALCILREELPEGSGTFVRPRLFHVTLSPSHSFLTTTPTPVLDETHADLCHTTVLARNTRTIHVTLALSNRIETPQITQPGSLVA